MTGFGIRASFLDFIDDPWRHVGRESDAARFHADGLLVVEDGRIIDFGAHDEVAARHAGLVVTTISDRLVLPGFIDGHVHFPQTRVIGAFGEHLLPWLEKWVFPEEIKFSDRAYAREAAGRFFDSLVASGTTTCQAFTTTASAATEELFDEAARRNMRLIAGLTGIDRLAPDGYSLSAENFYRDSKRLIERYHRQGRGLYAITPRNAHVCTPDTMAAAERLKREHPDCWVNTHLAETTGECEDMRELYPDSADYVAVYEKYGLVGPKFSGGHGVWLSDDEFDRLSAGGGAITFCPCSNLFLGSGLFRLGRATDPAHRVRLSFGSDVGGGNRLSMLNVLDEAYKVGMMNNGMLDDPAEAERNKLSAYRGFWSITLGGAEGLYIDDLVGNFDPGKEADFVVLDCNGGPPALRWRQSLIAEDGTPPTLAQAADLLFGLMVAGDDRAIEQTWAMGRQVYLRPGSS
ncbi:guanine deaminase [Rhodococcus oryzae]|uniref:guanine deaminase n=1 Tax=Rhodococcus oryzae TaxID=2571143 RepID=UPI003791844D